MRRRGEEKFQAKHNLRGSLPVGRIYCCLGMFLCFFCLAYLPAAASADVVMPADSDAASGQEEICELLPAVIVPDSVLRLGDDLIVSLSLDSQQPVEGIVCVAAYSGSGSMLYLAQEKLSLPGGQPVPLRLRLPQLLTAERFAAFFLAADGSLQPYAEMRDLGVAEIGIPLLGLQLQPAELQLQVGDSAPVQVLFTPAEASIRDLCWQSSDESVAQVVDGVVYARSAGQATVTAISLTGNKTASITVKVAEQLAAGQATTGAANTEMPFSAKLQGHFVIPAKTEAEYGFYWWSGTAERPANAAMLVSRHAAAGEQAAFDLAMSVDCAPGEYNYCAFLHLYGDSGGQEIYGEIMRCSVPVPSGSKLPSDDLLQAALPAGVSVRCFTATTNADYALSLSGGGEMQLRWLDASYQLLAETSGRGMLQLEANCAAGQSYYLVMQAESACSLSLQKIRLLTLRPGENLQLMMDLYTNQQTICLLPDEDADYRLTVDGEMGGMGELYDGDMQVDTFSWLTGSTGLKLHLTGGKSYMLQLTAYGIAPYTLTLERLSGTETADSAAG